MRCPRGPALAAGLLRKLAIKRTTGFTRALDSWADWHTLVDRRNKERYTPLQNRLRTCLGSGWFVEIMPFALGIQRSRWTAVLTHSVCNAAMQTCRTSWCHMMPG